MIETTMKKTILGLAALALMASCNQDLDVAPSQDAAITFDGAFVDNATRMAIDGSYTSANLQEFQVYATITNNKSHDSANIFSGERVVRGAELGQGSNWSYDVANTQYWVDGNTYRFLGIADGNVANVSKVEVDDVEMATSIHLMDASAQCDLLIAEPEAINYSKTAHGSMTVGFTFRHLLAKAKFTFENDITTNNGYSYRISQIFIQNAPKAAVYDIVAKTWTLDDPNRPGFAPYSLGFGDVVNDPYEDVYADQICFGQKMESCYERLLIPCSETMQISFHYELLKDGVVIDVQDRNITAQGITLKAGHAYNFVVSLPNPGEPIKFDVIEVRDWDEHSPELQ